MLKNIKKMLVVAGLVSAFLANTVYASVTVNQIQTVTQEQAKQGAWELDAQGQWKYSLNGVYVVNTWVESLTESGAWYFLNENGFMAANTYTVDGYYVDAQGIYRAVYTEEDTEKETEQKTEHKTEKETTDYKDPSIDEDLALMQEWLNNGGDIATGNYGLH